MGERPQWLWIGVISEQEQERQMRDGKQGRREVGVKRSHVVSQVVNGEYLFLLPYFEFYIETWICYCKVSFVYKNHCDFSVLLVCKWYIVDADVESEISEFPWS